MIRRMVCVCITTFCSLCACATVYNVPANTLRTLTAAEITGAHEFVLNDGSTLVVPASLGSALKIKPYVSTADGAAGTIEVESGVSSVQFLGGLLTGTGGSLTVKGIGCISFGATPSNDISYPVLNVASLTFADAGATGLVLTEKVTLVKTPTTCPVSVAAGATLALIEKNALDALGFTDDAIDLANFNIVLLKNAAVSSSKTIRVAPGCSVGVKPCDMSGKWNWMGAAETWQSAPSIVLGGEGSMVVFRNAPKCVYASLPISGVGDVSFRPDSPSQAETMIYGPMTFDGCFSVDNASVVLTTTSAFGTGTRTLRLADGARLQPNGTPTFSSLTLDGAATLRVLGNGLVSFGSVASGRSLSVDSADNTYGGKIAFLAGASFPPGFQVDCPLPVRLSFDDGASAGGLVCQTKTGEARRWPDASGVIDCTGLTLGGGDRAAVLHSPNARLINMPAAFAVAPQAKAEVVPHSLGSQVAVRAGAGSEVTIGDLSADWQSGLMLWIDPSETAVQPVNNDPANDCTYDGNHVFERIADVRGTQTTYALWNRRYYLDQSKNWQVYPYLVANGPNGKGYFSCGQYQKTGVTRTYLFPNGLTATESAAEARRIQLSKNGLTGTDAPTAAGAVTMVFGSQNGGGAAIVGTMYGAFGRTGTTLNAAITTNDQHDVYVNGVKVDPTVTKLSGGWDVITVVLDGERLSAFGWCGTDGINNDYTRSGGQNYGEILVFADVPSEDQRVAAERYLAKKWGLAGKYAGKPSLVRLSGTGTVKTADAVEASGSFSGTIELDGGTLAVAPQALPAGEENLPKTGLLGWYDPDDADSILLNRDSGYSDAAANPDLVWALYDRSRPERANGDPCLFGVKARRPKCHREARGDGPVRNWIHCEKLGTTYGSVLRFMQLPLPSLDAATVTAVPLSGVREVFMVRDSSRGGGSLVVDKINGTDATTDMLAKPRRTAKASDPIWPSGTSATLTGGETRLNGQAVNGRWQGFTGGAELVSFSTTGAYAPVAFSDLWNLEKVSDSAYEIYGETLIYGSVLSADDCAKVEDYLSWKWLGVMPAACSDLRGAMVTGTGTVTGSKLAEMPKVDSAFAGTVKVADDADLAMTVDTASGTVTGSLILPSATLDLPETVAVAVTLTGPVADRRMTYTLVDCAGFARPVTWTLTFTDGDGKSRKATLRTEGGKLLLDVRGGYGLVLIVQ